ncbi:hypothetical protein MRS44_006141 [Fusarium solani]|uniref:uncharacterized protein n=1 Tax=Fusarium solani TaxID=169388 RepID=UPI0032C3EB86|nr:hypothetical protein MRS44_006141 [Fusarium solani]
MITSNKGLGYSMTNPLVLGAGLDLSKLNPAQLHALDVGLAGRGAAPTAKVKKIKKDGQGTSKFAQARCDNKGAKEAKPASSSSSSSPLFHAPCADHLVGDCPVFTKTAAASSAAEVTEAEPEPEAAAKSSEAEPEAAVDFVDRSLGGKADEEMTTV